MALFLVIKGLGMFGKINFAIRVTHEPTGESVVINSGSAGSERVARENAIAIIKSRLVAKEMGIERSGDCVATYDLPDDVNYPHDLSDYRVIDNKKAVDLDMSQFQESVRPWLIKCFGEMVAGDKEERSHRFLEEALELVQACGCTASEAHQLVDYVYGRPVGEKFQEVGGVMVTLAALCLAQGVNMHDAGEVELERIWEKISEVRAKQAAKPKYSPLPE